MCLPSGIPLDLGSAGAQASRATASGRRGSGGKGMPRAARRSLILVGVLAVSLAAAPLPALAGQPQEQSSSGGFAGLGATLCTLVYSPMKISYAASGLVVGSLAWAWSFGNRRVTGPIFRAALRGDYVVTPAHLRGERPLRFTGRR